MPFGKYVSFQDCVSKNSSKANPKAYCASVERNIKKGKGYSKGAIEKARSKA